MYIQIKKIELEDHEKKKLVVSSQGFMYYNVGELEATMVESFCFFFN